MFGIQKGDNSQVSTLKIIIFISIFLSPLLFSLKHYYYFSTLKYTFLAFFGSLAFGFLIPLVFQNTYTLTRQTKVLIGVSSVFIVWLFITSLTGLNPSNSIWSSLGRHSGFLTYFFSFILFLSAIFVYSKETIWAPLKAFVLGGVLASVSVYLSPILLNVQWDFLINSSRAGTFGNTTYASIFLGFSLFASLILFFKESSRYKKVLWLLASLFLICNPVFINLSGIFQGEVTGIISFIGDARAGFLSIVVGLVTSFLVYLSFSKQKTLRIIFQSITAVCLVSGLLFVYSSIQKDSKVQNYLIETGDGARLVYWDMTLQAISERPVLGFGLENYGYIHRSYFDPILLTSSYPNETWTDKPHNAFLEIALVSGFVGLILFIACVGYLLILLVRRGVLAETSQDKMISALLFGLIISHLLQVFFAFETVSSIQAFWIMLALGIVWSSGTVVSFKKKSQNPYTSLCIVGGVSILVFIMIYNFSIAAGSKSRAIRTLANGGIQERTEGLAGSLESSPIGKQRTEAQFLDFIVSGYQTNWNVFDSEIKTYGLEELRVIFDYVSKRSDEDSLDTRLALVASRSALMIYIASNGQEQDMLEAAKRYAFRVIETTPRDELGYLFMRDILNIEKNNKQSQKFAEMARLANPESAEYLQ